MPTEEKAVNKFAYDVRNVCSIRELIETSADEFGANPAFLVKNDDGDIIHITYSRFMEEIKALATFLCSKGLEGKKVAVIGKNSYEWALSYMAITCGVGIVVSIDSLTAGGDLGRYLCHELLLTHDALIVCHLQRLHRRRVLAHTTTHVGSRTDSQQVGAHR